MAILSLVNIILPFYNYQQILRPNNLNYYLDKEQVQYLTKIYLFKNKVVHCPYLFIKNVNKFCTLTFLPFHIQPVHNNI